MQHKHCSFLIKQMEFILTDQINFIHIAKSKKEIFKEICKHAVIINWSAN